MLQLQQSPRQHGKVATGYFGSGRAAEELHRASGIGDMMSPLCPGLVLAWFVYPQRSPVHPKRGEPCKLGTPPHSPLNPRCPLSTLGTPRTAWAPKGSIRKGKRGDNHMASPSFAPSCATLVLAQIRGGPPRAGHAARDRG